MAGTTPLGTTVTLTPDNGSDVVLSDVLDINYSPGSTEMIDITDLSDTTRVKLAGYVDTGSVSVTLNFTDTVHESLIDLAGPQDDVVTAKITFANPTTPGTPGGESTWAGEGVLDLAGFSISGGSGVTSSFSIHQLSAWTFTP